MYDIIAPIVFVALAINIPVLIAYLIGLQFQITDYSCKKEVKGVKTNILTTKIVQLINVIIFIVIMIILHVF